MPRRGQAIRIVLVAAIAIALNHGLLAAAQESDPADARSFTSAAYGYRVEWTGAWEIVSGDQSLADTQVSLRTADQTTTLLIKGVSATAADSVLQMLDLEIRLSTSGVGAFNIEVIDRYFVSASLAAMLISFDLGFEAQRFEWLVEARRIQNVIVMTMLSAAGRGGLAAASGASRDVTFNGEPIFPSLSAQTAESDEGDPPAETPGVYVAPTFDVSLEFDPNRWAVEFNGAAEENGGRDILTLLRDDEEARIYFETFASITDASECLDLLSEEAYGEHDFDPLTGDDGAELRGSGPGFAFAGYRYDVPDWPDRVAYVECRELPGAVGVFGVSLFTHLTRWDDAVADLTPILKSVRLGGEPVSAWGIVADAVPYSSPSYGFSVEFDREFWTGNRERSRNGVDTLELEAAGDFFLEVSGFTAGRRDTAQTCVEDFLDDFDAELIDVANPRTGEVLGGASDFGYYAVKSYDDHTGMSWVLFVECVASPDEAFLVRIVGEAPFDEADRLLEIVIPIVDSIVF